jgi:hypothetical protein
MIPVIAFRFNTSIIVTSDLLSISTIQQSDTHLPTFYIRSYTTKLVEILFVIVILIHTMHASLFKTYPPPMRLLQIAFGIYGEFSLYHRDDLISGTKDVFFSFRELKTYKKYCNTNAGVCFGYYILYVTYTYTRPAIGPPESVI